MVIRVNRYVQINTPNSAGPPAEIPEFSPADFFGGGVPGYWQGEIQPVAEFEPSYLFGNGEVGTWLGSAAPDEDVTT